MKASKRIFCALLAICLVLGFAACGEKPKTDEKINIALIKGPSGIGMLKLMNEYDEKYDFKVSSSPDEIPAYLSSKEVDIAACPLNVAANLYQKKNGDIEMIAISTLGVLYLVDTTGEINSVADLSGKKISSTGEGASPQYILEFILKENGIDPKKDVEIDYYSENSQLATLTSSKKNVTISLLAEPFATVAIENGEGLTRAIDLTEEWNKLAQKNGTMGTLAQGCVVVRKDFLKANPKAVADFLKEYEESINYVESNPDGAALLAHENEFFASLSIAKASIPNCNIDFITGEEMKKIANQNLKVLFDANPSSVGGAMPDDNFYYIYLK